MSRTYNFSAGPAALPEAVLKQAQSEMLEWGKAHASVMEVSHRGKEFIALAKESEDDLRTLLQIPQNYKVLFLQGGATQHFAQIPMNIAARDQSADYIVNGAMTEGYAIVAYPAEYRNSGVMTFIVTDEGAIYQKDLGPTTAADAKAMNEVNLDASWSLVDDNDAD